MAVYIHAIEQRWLDIQIMIRDIIIIVISYVIYPVAYHIKYAHISMRSCQRKAKKAFEFSSNVHLNLDEN